MTSLPAIGTWFLAHEVGIRVGGFAVAFALVGAWERCRPARTLRLSRGQRWVNNLALVVIDTLLLRLFFPAAAVGFASLVAARGWGVFNHLAVAPWLAGIVSVVALDLVVWLQHVLMHAVPILWRVHRVHHADPDYDLTTGTRFHPIEILLSMLVKCAAIAALGAPVFAVLVFEVVLGTSALFTHANARLPPRIDGVLRRLVVTPDMHRVHHSVAPDEATSNFGFNLSCWDRLFGTYRAQPRGGHDAMTIGVAGLTAPRDVIWLRGLLLLPFRPLPGSAATPPAPVPGAPLGEEQARGTRR
ncbi:MAG: sterol desaturase family protein [Gammaproteobacteria bacterium]